MTAALAMGCLLLIAAALEGVRRALQAEAAARAQLLAEVAAAQAALAELAAIRREVAEIGAAAIILAASHPRSTPRPTPPEAAPPSEDDIDTMAFHFDPERTQPSARALPAVAPNGRGGAR